jgi:Bardet-Biedl syndrome 1 protein
VLNKNMKIQCLNNPAVLLVSSMPSAHRRADNNNPRTPAIAVGSGPFIYIYRNLRPYYKFSLPPVELSVRHT